MGQVKRKRAGKKSDIITQPLQSFFCYARHNLLQYKGDWIKAASKPFWASTMGDDGGIDNPIVVDVELD